MYTDTQRRKKNENRENDQWSHTLVAYDNLYSLIMVIVIVTYLYKTVVS